ncbi:hypothetical protein [Streptomyces hydrogenans]|uniref:hypothetical protein n=1 Tax=Streptomyces hydrogenans TaxID=1873719 RepID=UPI003818D5BA
MLDEAAVAVATGAASNVVAYLLQGRADTLRARLGAVFQRGTAEQRSNALQALEDDSVALARHTVTEAEAAARWTGFLTAFLAAYPDARTDLETLASAAPPDARNVIIGSQHNHGSGTFIGGDNHGGVNVTNGAD